jgi:hypothetical protein
VFVLRPSSPVPAAIPEPQIAASELPIVLSKDISDEPFIDKGLPIPSNYNLDIIRALIQDPFHVFIYWEVRERSLRSLTRYFSPEDAASFKIVLKLIELDQRIEAFFEVDRRGRYWMMVFPDRRYRFEIGVRSNTHGYISLVRSNEIRTPRGTVSSEPPRETGFEMDPSRFIDILEASGFAASQVRDVTLSAAERAERDRSILHRLFSALSPELRAALLAAIGGEELTFDLIEGLPESLRKELVSLLHSSGGAVAAAALVHYLPELLRELTEDELEWISGKLHPVHFAPRFFTAGSEHLMRPGSELHVPALPRRRVPGSPS